MQTKTKQSRMWPAFFVAVAATGSTLAPAQAGIFSISEKDEIKAGEQVRQQAYKEYGQPLAANHPMSQRVKALGARFAKMSARKNIPYSYTVIKNDKLLNAFAAPGGPVFVTTKLVNTAANDAELAYVLGHETAHIDRKHIVKAVEKQQKVGLGVGILGTILGGGSGGNIFQVFGNVAFTVWTRGYSRDQENDSDVYGTRWMSQLGFDPRAAVSMLGRLGGGSGGGLDKYLSTHPAPKDRQANVTKLIEKEKLMDVATKAGGPRTTATDLPEYTYSKTGTTATDDETTYPDDEDDDGDFDDEDYNEDGDDGDNDDDSVFDDDSTRATFGAPLLLVRRGEYNVIMAPVGGFARWAGAKVTIDQANESVMTIQRGRNSIRLRRNSTTATINGRSARLSAAVAVYNELLYAPLGSLSEGVGAKATLSRDNRTIVITRDGENYYADVPTR